jgi:hypothetical protein
MTQSPNRTPRASGGSACTQTTPTTNFRSLSTNTRCANKYQALNNENLFGWSAHPSLFSSVSLLCWCIFHCLHSASYVAECATSNVIYFSVVLVYLSLSSLRLLRRPSVQPQNVIYFSVVLVYLSLSSLRLLRRRVCNLTRCSVGTVGAPFARVACAGGTSRSSKAAAAAASQLAVVVAGRRQCRRRQRARQLLLAADHPRATRQS